jgi:hypothetical protein
MGPFHQPALNHCGLMSSVVVNMVSSHNLRSHGRVIHVADDGTDNLLFNWPVQANGADGFKLALCFISDRLEGIDARIVHTPNTTK